MKPEIKKLLILNLPYLLFVWLFDKVGAAVRLSPGADASAKLLHLGDGFTAAFSSIAPSFHPADLALGIAGAVIVRLIIYTKGKNAKKYRRGTEYGSARWGGADDIKPYTDPVFENNIPLTQTERLTMNSRPKQPKYARNKNILVIGGSGSGKTRFFVKPSLMQCTSKDFPTSYIVTDPKGTLILETGKMLQRYKYRIKVLNTINFKKSMKYNPFAYLRSEKDILKLVNTIIVNTKGDVIGRSLAIEALNYKNAYINPVIRIAVSTHGMLFLCDRPMNAILDKGKTDIPMECYLRYGESLTEGVNRLVHNALPHATEDFKPEFNIVYHFENETTNRLIYLFIVDIKDDSILCTPRFKNSKLWSFKQIEENMGKGFFSSCFEDEYEHLKDVICIREKYKES